MSNVPGTSAGGAAANAVVPGTNLSVVPRSALKAIKKNLAGKFEEAEEKFCDRCSKRVYESYLETCEKGTKNGKKCKHCVKVKKPCTYSRPPCLNGLFNELLEARDTWAAIPEGGAGEDVANEKLEATQKKFTRRLERGIRADCALKGPWRPDSQLATDRDAATSLRRIAGALEEKNNISRILLSLPLFFLACVPAATTGDF